MHQATIRNNLTGKSIEILMPEFNELPNPLLPGILIGKDKQMCQLNGHSDDHDRRSCFRDRVVLHQARALCRSYGGPLVESEIQYCACSRALDSTGRHSHPVPFKDIGYVVIKPIEGVIIREVLPAQPHRRCEWCGHRNDTQSGIPTVSRCRRCRFLQKSGPADESLLGAAARLLHDENPAYAQGLIWSERAETFLVAFRVRYVLFDAGAEAKRGDEVVHRLELPSAIPVVPVAERISRALLHSKFKTTFPATRHDRTPVLTTKNKPILGVLIHSRFIQGCEVRDARGDFALVVFGRPLHYLEFIWLAFRVLVSKHWNKQWNTFLVQPKDRFRVGQTNVSSCIPPLNWLDQIILCCLEEINLSGHLPSPEFDVARLDRLLERIKRFRGRAVALFTEAH